MLSHSFFPTVYRETSSTVSSNLRSSEQSPYLRASLSAMNLAFLSPSLPHHSGRSVLTVSKCVQQQPSSPSPSRGSMKPTTRRRDGSLPGRPDAKTYQVTVEDPRKGIVHKYAVPEDRYVWHSMTEQGADIPASCRHGCCTTCAVKVKSGQVQQDQALGLLKEMRANGYALLCVSYPLSDIHCVLQEEDEVYVKQFGSSFESGGVGWGGFVPEDD